MTGKLKIVTPKEYLYFGVAENFSKPTLKSSEC